MNKIVLADSLTAPVRQRTFAFALLSVGVFQLLSIGVYGLASRFIDMRLLLVFGLVCFGLGQQFAVPPIVTMALGSLHALVLREALVLTVADCFYVLALCFLVGVIAMIFVRPITSAPPSSEAH